MLTIVVEGISDEAVVRKLCLVAQVAVGPVHIQRGKVQLDEHIAGYNAAARYAPWLVVRDLNSDAECAPELREKLLPEPAEYMYLRIAVRSIEAWLFADRDGIARYLRISKALVPRDTEALEKPKRTLVNLARRSRKRAIREDMVPAEGVSAEVGPGYTARVIEFSTYHWNPEVAAAHADSLKRCFNALRQIAAGLKG
jgi:hypothetical protein